MFVANKKLLNYSTKPFGYLANLTCSLFSSASNCKQANKASGTVEDEDSASQSMMSRLASTSRASNSGLFFRHNGRWMLRGKHDYALRVSGGLFFSERVGTEDPSAFYQEQRTEEEQDREETRGDEERRTNDNNNNEESSGESHARKLWLPLLAIFTQKLSNVSCLFGIGSPDRNKLTGRVTLVQYAANNPIEDRYSCMQLNAIDGFFVGVFDGHGGWQMADFAMKNLGKELDEILKQNKGKKYGNEEDYIRESLNQAFDVVENKFLEVVRIAYGMGFVKTTRVGCCALVSVVHNNKLYVANVGDSKGVMLRSEGKGFSVLKMNKKLNAASKKEQERLKQTFTQDDDIVVCRGTSGKACYVKNRLQPTRAFGDYYLKHKEFNDPGKVEE
eukprot:TRINITY_DN837_c0_g1_i6.p1 TRINITY_DN837_c0_g1~~TRINITY_DN837_c0_g1_i6.p1  ORF type:complete len:389 (-),score=107.23 TRINITY_DN837_c0_g1_i6:567-1733(-)